MVSAVTPPVMPLAPRDSGPAPRLAPKAAKDEAERRSACQQCDSDGFAYDLSAQLVRCTHGYTIRVGGAADHA